MLEHLTPRPLHPLTGSPASRSGMRRAIVLALAALLAGGCGDELPHPSRSRRRRSSPDPQCRRLIPRRPRGGRLSSSSSSASDLMRGGLNRRGSGGRVSPEHEAPGSGVGRSSSALLTKAYQTAAVLFEILDTHNNIKEKKKLYVPYNILPLDLESTDQAAMQYPEIQAAVYALRSTRGLPWPKEHEKKPDEKKTDKDLF